MKKVNVFALLTALMLLVSFFPAYAEGDIRNFEGEVKEILQTVSPSLVKVISENQKRYFATGIAIDKDLVISNVKVVPRHYNVIYIRTTEGEQYPAQILASDFSSSVLLLKIDKKVLKPIRQAKSSEVGDWVALVGAFYRKFPAIYHGFISSSSEDELLVNAPVAPGASGGAIVNKKGELVGVIRGRFRYAQSPDYTYVSPDAELIIRSSRSQHKELCYALPVKMVYNITDDLEKYGKVRRGWLGFIVEPIRNGLRVTQVIQDSPAFKAGIRPGDVILKMNNKNIRQPEDMARLVRILKPGQSTKIELLRNDLNKSVVAVIGELKDVKMEYGFNVFPDIPERLPHVENYEFSFVGAPMLGVDTITLSPELAKEFKVAEGSGLMVSKVYQGTPAEKSGLQVSDVIIKVAGRQVAKNSDLRVALASVEENEPVELTVNRKGKLLKVKTLPTRDQRFGPILDRFSDNIRDFQIRVDEENRGTTDGAVRNRRNGHLIQWQGEPDNHTEPENPKDKQALENYKKQLEKMRKEQEKLKKDMQRLMERMEKKEKDNKEETNKDK